MNDALPVSEPTVNNNNIFHIAHINSSAEQLSNELLSNEIRIGTTVKIYNLKGKTLINKSKN